MYLALDTSQIQSCIALFDNERVIDSITGSTQVSHSQSLLTLIDQLLKKNLKTSGHTSQGPSLNDIDTFAVGVGPGSFTGIRIGCSTVKAFAQVNHKKIVPFSSLKAAYYSCQAGSDKNAVVTQKAYQNLVFAGWYSHSSWNEAAISEVELQQQFASEGFSRKLYRDTFVSAEGIFKAVIESQDAVDYNQLKANYLRASQAEIKYSQLE